MTLGEYAQTFRLARAEELLRTGSASISQIIEDLGYRNRSHFYRVFRGRYGLTPGRYREGCGKDHQNSS